VPNFVMNLNKENESYSHNFEIIFILFNVRSCNYHHGVTHTGNNNYLLIMSEVVLSIITAWAAS